MTDPTLRAYLLGQLPEADAARLEERALEDRELFDELRGVEDDLFDEHARGQLTRLEQGRFLARYGGDTERLRLARALALETAARAAAPAPARVIPFPRRRWIELAAAAAVVIVVGGLMMRGGGKALDAPAPTTSPATTAASATPVPQPPAITAVVALTLGTTRSSSNAQVAAIPAKATTTQLRIRLNAADQYDRYAIEIRSSAGNVVWGDAALRATPDGSALLLIASVPARDLPSGAYEIAVRGANGNSPLEDLGFITLELRTEN